MNQEQLVNYSRRLAAANESYQELVSQIGARTAELAAHSPEELNAIGQQLNNSVTELSCGLLLVPASSMFSEVTFQPRAFGSYGLSRTIQVPGLGGIMVYYDHSYGGRMPNGKPYDLQNYCGVLEWLEKEHLYPEAGPHTSAAFIFHTFSPAQYGRSSYEAGEVAQLQDSVETLQAIYVACGLRR